MPRIESKHCKIYRTYPTRELSQESYISHKRVSHFRHLFLHCSDPYIFLFSTSIASVATHEHIAKISVSKCPILKFLWEFENCQNWIYVEGLSLLFLSPHISVLLIFKHFLAELECWNFRRGLVPPFFMRFF